MYIRHMVPWFQLSDLLFQETEDDDMAVTGVALLSFLRFALLCNRSRKYFSESNIGGQSDYTKKLFYMRPYSGGMGIILCPLSSL